MARGTSVLDGPPRCGSIGAMLTASARTRFEELAETSASPVVVGRLRALFDAGTDYECYKINAFRLATELGVPRGDAVRALLFATRIGLLDLSWDIHCPSCHGVPEYHKHLMNVRTTAHCGLCVLDWTLNLEDQVEVTFTVNPDVRKITYPNFDELPFPQNVGWIRDMGAREGRVPTLGDLFRPGDEKTLTGTVTEGVYRVYVPSHLDQGMRVVVAGPLATSDQEIEVRVAEDGTLSVPEVRIAPGRIRLTVHYGYVKAWGFTMRRDEPERNWVSATYVASQQDFRDLFAAEFLALDASFSVRSTTLMFSDIRGSTEMYEALGDARAYAIVQEHFRVMVEIIRRHEGGVVKTIGDAVMAVFPVNVDGVRAACAIQRAFADVGEPLRGVEVKIGLHRGPTIVVTSNRTIDYFGRTVNIAARTQGAAAPKEVLITDAVLADAEVLAFVDGLPIRAFEAKVKGVAEPIKLHAIGSPSPQVASLG